MPEIKAHEAGGANVVAFLDMLAWSEGTDNGRQRTHDRGYDVLVGGGVFRGYEEHPNVLVPLPKLKIKSTAAGRYQFLKRTWDVLRTRLALKDFGPLSQDVACIELIRGRRALEDLKAGSFDAAVQKCQKEWASLPGAGYGQHEQKLDRLRDAYVRAGGKVSP